VECAHELVLPKTFEARSVNFRAERRLSSARTGTADPAGRNLRGSAATLDALRFEIYVGREVADRSRLPERGRPRPPVVLTTPPTLTFSSLDLHPTSCGHTAVLQRERGQEPDRDGDSPVVTTSTWVLVLSMRSTGAVVVSLT
jgi:hypothetical protein